MKNLPLLRIALAGCLAALTLCATLFIRIPIPNGGYLNAGDAIVLVTGFLLSPKLAFLSAAIGSSLADLISGYALYAPVTFFIKGFMSLIVVLSQNTKKRNPEGKRIPYGAFLLSELIMISGYCIFETFLYGFSAAIPNTLLNLLQGIFGITVAVIVVSVILRRIKK